MGVGNIIREKRIDNKITQEELAEKLFVTRQTVSRWETDTSLPSFETLIKISDLFHISLDYLLKGENNKMAERIIDDMKKIKWYKKYFKATMFLMVIMLVIMLLILIFFCIGRAYQVSFIDRINPFLQTKTGYALLPNAPQKNIESYTSDNYFGDGEWLQFKTGKYEKNDVAVIQHKGSYVYRVRTMNRKNVPQEMQEKMTGNYEHYSYKIYGNKNGKKFSWWPFS